MKTQTTSEKRDRAQELAALGFSINILSGPRGEVEKGSRDWPHIAYDVELKYNERRVLLTPYRLGVGHVNQMKPRAGATIAVRLSVDEESLLLCWQSQPQAEFKDKDLWAAVAAKLAKYQKVSPQLDDVMHSLLLDGDPYFNNESFEDWCGNFGYDTDSRKAEDMYRACCETGRQIMRSVPREVIEQAREIIQDL